MAKIPLDNRKKGLILLLAASVVGVVLLFVLLGTARGGKDDAEDEKIVNVSPDIPEAESDRLSDSKMDAYRSSRRGRSSIDSYWENIGSDGNPDDDPLEVLAEDRRTSFQEVTVDELFPGDPPPAGSPAEPSERGRYTREQREADYERQRRQIIADVMAARQQTATAEASPDASAEEDPQPVVETRDRIDVERVLVRRSGTVSSMDDNFGTVSSSGLSTLDGGDEFETDDGYPFECMFVKTEKIRSGARVPIRLLSDMVVNGQLVPKNTHLMATCTIGNRLDLNIQSVEIGGRIVNLDFDAYDANDHTRGIYCPDVDNTAVQQVKQQAGTTFMQRARSSVGRIAQDVLQAGSVFISGSGKDMEVTVPAGYKFFIVKSRRGRTN